MAPNQGHPMYETWVEYALSTNQRGAGTVAKLERHGSLRSARTLDVGCAFAGFPIACARAGAEAVGIEVDPGLLRLAEANVADSHVPVALHVADVTDPERMKALGSFDFITCADVIEHVRDVPTALANLASCLAPGGVLYLQIPNGFSTGLVLKDGHFGLFGITLLGRDDAERYYHEAGFGGSYDVGDFFPLDVYTGQLAGHGVHLVELLDFESALRAAPDLVRRQLEEIRAARDGFGEHRELSTGIRERVRLAVDRHCREVAQALTMCEQSAPAEPSGEALRADLARRFAMTCWEIIARRGPERIPLRGGESA